MKSKKIHTLVIGSGAAGLNAALQLRKKGISDILILTEGLHRGTSINTGSDKQTYYKLSLCGNSGDSPYAMAGAYFNGGAMHGDLALVEAAVSSRAFMNLVNMGLPFPTDRFGQYAGYKTDHDPSFRATSIGPYTSREMCRALIQEVLKEKIEVYEKRNVIELITLKEGESRRAAGAIAMDESGNMEVYEAENVIFAVGGPGGIYETSVYPGCHTGAIGLALREGAIAANLTESQFGMASIKFRWNVSGTFMQVLPRFVSVDPDDINDEKEFLRSYFDTTGEMNSRVFLKGYQWPFDSAKVLSGSSIIDILVYIETVQKGRKVYLDFRSDPDDFSFDDLSEEAGDYLKKSGARLLSPIERLEKMNPGAINLYLENGIDIRKEKLEIAVCAQHNNGGLAADIWWQSENIRHLFPIGEVNGSHGVNRPGGSALNSGQVGGFRAAEYIASVYGSYDLDSEAFNREVNKRISLIEKQMHKGQSSRISWKQDRKDFQKRMSANGAFIRTRENLKRAVSEAADQLEKMEEEGRSMKTAGEIREYFRNRHLCYTHLIYLKALLFSAESGTGSRGSGLVLNESGEKIQGLIGDEWHMEPEDVTFRNSILYTSAETSHKTLHQWVKRREIPREELWFETLWKEYQNKEIYR
jgi:succinate dehydrogenase/fumarate reductase flavoprotein subunit